MFVLTQAWVIRGMDEYPHQYAVEIPWFWEASDTDAEAHLDLSSGSWGDAHRSLEWIVYCGSCIAIN